MYLKKLFLLISVACCSQAAMANLTVSDGNASLQLYGVIDTGVAYISHYNNGNKNKTDTINGLLSTPNIGLKGNYLINADLTFISNFQAMLIPSLGQIYTKKELFSRDAYIGLDSHSMGTLTIGRQWDLNDDFFFGTVFKGGYNSGAIFKLSEFDAISEVYRNAIKYTSPSMNSFQLAAMYGINDIHDVNTEGHMFNLGAKYTVNNLMIGATYSSEQDTNQGAQRTGNFYNLTTLGGNYKFGNMNARLGFTYADISGSGTFQSIPSLARSKTNSDRRRIRL
jgi:predicted porin